ncbi:hypothetical protein [Halorubrum sp. SP9]|uniref:hypothetical protein n=1 Tax=Halorubrum sp. SP9 TaxID=1537267 RepID=UPI0010F640A7|nr:hypothetical protein [Halorubrum sp. SP9]TKX68082.1 hypothetical protein EXE45_12465 [Halorubrum sp. SP9]
MSDKRDTSHIGRLIGIGVAGLAVLLMILDRTTDLSVPYGYDGSGFNFLIGVLVALLIVVYTGLRYSDGI